MARHSPFFMPGYRRPMDTQANSNLDLELATQRLRLRVPCAGDAARIGDLIGEWEVARMLGRVPYPYPPNGGLEWVSELRPKLQSGKAAVFALVEREHSEDGAIGCAGLEWHENKDAPELGYWLGKPFWGRGLMTEAARAVVEFGFRSLATETIEAGYLPDNPASASVLRKLGFREAGQEQRWSRPRNCETTVVLMALDRRDYRVTQEASS